MTAELTSTIRRIILQQDLEFVPAMAPKLKQMQILFVAVLCRAPIPPTPGSENQQKSMTKSDLVGTKAYTISQIINRKFARNNAYVAAVRKCEVAVLQHIAKHFLHGIAQKTY